MQFVRNGPDIPEHLLQANEDGRVVFFCGAGISMPKLLTKPNPLARSKPLGFASLVDSLYTEFGVTPNPRQERAIEAGQYDIAIGLLEAKVAGGRTVVRQALASILKIPLEFNRSTAHEWLLTLSKNHEDGCTRLVTTNFDRLFEKAIKDMPLQVKRFQAPFLPIPKKQWDGLVYLHGLLPEKSTPSNLDHLVVSSGDFGRAYLTERWASRFVSELFRNYIVCFVGYSLNDPVLRYMTDAIAADRQRGEPALEMFAFGSYSKGKGEREREEWEDKNVTPILYLKVEKKENEHAHLLETLQVWSETYSDGVCAKKRIVAECARMLPLESTKEDDFVSRVMWALSDPSGLPAEHFAELDRVPSLDWLEPLCEERYQRTDLECFGIPTGVDFDDGYTFSLLQRPSPSNLAPNMTLGSEGKQNSEWDEVMQRLAPWLTRHLNDPALLLWMANLGGSLHHNLVKQIRLRLNELNRLEHDGDTDKLEHIRSGSPNAIPTPPMQTLWSLLLTGRVTKYFTWTRHFPLGLWKTRFKRDGLTPTLRLELHEYLTPRVTLHKPIKWSAKDDNREPKQIKDLVRYKIVLSADNAPSDLKELAKDKCWIEESPKLLTEFSSRLSDALDLMRELGSANDLFDPSCVSRRSISEHEQNTDPNDWTALISLTRDTWLSAAEQSPELARWVAEAWSREPYPLFRRLAFFAAAQGKTIPSSQGLNWLLANEHYWLWAPETMRETMRLLVALAPQLTKAEMGELEKVILNESRTDHERPGIGDLDIWLRLAKIDQAGATLSEDGRKKLTKLSGEHPDWKLATNERDEFSSWSCISAGDGNNPAIPRCRRELVKWLKQPTTDPLLMLDWQQRCRNNFPTTACALYALAQEGDWPAGHWKRALQAWTEEKLVERSWRYMAPVLANATDEQLLPFALELSSWLEAIAKTIESQDEIFLRLCRRVLNLKYEKGAGSYFVPSTHGQPGGDNFVTCAINHPIGCTTQALLSWWYRKTPKDGQGLPDKLETIFTMLCDRSFDKLRHGRVILAVNLISLFRIDRDWTTKHLLHLFNWQTSEIEACAAWQGFLWSRRLYHPLMKILKPAFLETASHYEMLANYGELGTPYGEQYASLLTFAALNRGDIFEAKELAAATRALPKDGLGHAAQELVRMTEGTDTDKRQANYWTNRAEPYLREIWPKTQDKISPDFTTDLGRVCITAREKFPQAFDLLKHWLRPTTTPSYSHRYARLVELLNETEICSRFPEQALDFLDSVTPEQPHWIPEELRTCLEAIQTSKPELEKNSKHQRLMVCVRQQE